MHEPASPHPRPDFTGVWQAKLEKSVFLLGPPPREILTRIEHREPHIDQEVLLTQASGSEQRLVFHFATAGEETTNAVGGGLARTRTRWDGTELVIESWLEMPDRRLHLKDHWSLSADGQTLTMAHRDDDLAGQIVVNEKAPCTPQ